MCSAADAAGARSGTRFLKAAIVEPGMSMVRSLQAPGALALALLGLVACPRGGSGDGDGDAGSETSNEGDDGADTAGNTAPPAPRLQSPSDGAQDVAVASELCWEAVSDPDGDAVRYNVYVDGAKLSQGIIDDEGYEGPCTGDLNFNFEQTYQWYVEAFEVDGVGQVSDPSDTWTFTTAYDGMSQTVFDDDFEQGLEWEVAGDAGSGAWEHGHPTGTVDGEALAQSGDCAQGGFCLFTGQNPEAILDEDDVSGGSTSIISPAFNLGNAAAATVEISRFFYKSAGAEGSLRVEVLIPTDDPEQPEVLELEALTADSVDAQENLWTPIEFALCDAAALTDGVRLRVTAQNEGPGIVEALIDDVSVHAHDDASICSTGEGGLCDPSADTPCPDDMLCCAQHVLNDGVFRCTPAVAGLDYDNPTESPDDPGNGPMGCHAPDLITDPDYIEPGFNEIMVFPDTCELQEGCVGGLGLRRIMRFATAVPNVGSKDLVMGIPPNNPDLFHYSGCHDHYHFDGFAEYQLLDGDDQVTSGHKQAFCMLDTISWAWPFELSVFDCANQGISRGFVDVYEDGLPCQWIDITEIDPGDYTLRIELNPIPKGFRYHTLNERDYTNNVIEVPVTIE